MKGIVWKNIKTGILLTIPFLIINIKNKKINKNLLRQNMLNIKIGILLLLMERKIKKISKNYMKQII